MEKQLTINLTNQELRKEILKTFLEMHYVQFDELCNNLHETILENIRKGSFNFSVSFSRPNDLKIWTVLKEYLIIQGYSFDVKTDEEGMPTGEVILTLNVF